MSEVNKLFFLWREIHTNDKSKFVLVSLETGDFVPCTQFCLCRFTTDFIFSTNLSRYQNVLKCIPSNIESRP